MSHWLSFRNGGTFISSCYCSITATFKVSDRRISGNGLVSYYINLILEGVGFTSTNTKAAINGALQVWNLIAAMTGAMLIDLLGRRTLFIISNVGMLIGECQDHYCYIQC